MINIQKFAEDLATALTTDSENWKVDPNSAKFHSERVITLGNIGYKNQFSLNLEMDGHLRVIIKPLSPVGVSLNGSTWHYTDGKPSISVNGERPVDQIARDIRRRLMSDALTWWNRNYTAAAESIERRSVVEMFQEVLLNYPDARCIGGGPSTISGPNWTIRTDSSSTRLDIKFTDLPHDKIIQLLDLYYQHILNKQGDFSYGR